MKAEDLKNSILQLAMQGKLVPQDPNDEPASVLLEKIYEEKERLIKEKKIKRNNKESFIFRKNGHFYERIGKKGEPDCIDDELFNIPDNWEWCTLGDLFYCTSGLSYKKALLNDKSEKMVRILRGGNINDEKYEFKDNDLFISDEYVKPELYLKKNILITPAVSSLEQTGKIARIDKDFNSVVVGGFVLMLNPFLIDDTFSKFYLNMLASDFHRSNCRSITRKSGQAFYNLSRAKLLNLPIVLPPLNEQKRIVNKIEEILPFIDEYKINKEKLDKLNLELSTKLKSSILQEAVQGKLVPQNPNDESASILLEKIRKEKERLIKEKKIKKNKNESFIYKKNNHFYEQIENNELICIDEKLPFEIPETWEWCTLGNILTVNGGKRVPKGYKLLDEPTSHIYIRVANMKNGTIEKNNLKYIDDNIYNQIKKYTISKDDLYITVAGTIGKVGSVPEYFDGMNLTENANKLTNISINKKLLQHILTSNYIQNQLNIKTTKVAQPKLAIKRILSTIIAIPPLNEQKRIVNKIEELLSLINDINIY